jgi:hypothetical protein
MANYFLLLTTTTGSMSISGELFEKLYLSPQNLNQVGDLRKRFGNPTP